MALQPLTLASSSVRSLLYASIISLDNGETQTSNVTLEKKVNIVKYVKGGAT